MKHQLTIASTLFSVLPIFIGVTLGVPVEIIDWSSHNWTGISNIKRSLSAINGAKTPGKALPDILRLDIEHANWGAGVIKTPDEYEVRMRLYNVGGVDIEVLHIKPSEKLPWNIVSREGEALRSSTTRDDTFVTARERWEAGFTHTLVPGLFWELGYFYPCKYYKCGPEEYTIQFTLPLYPLITAPDGTDPYTLYPLSSNTFQVDFFVQARPLLLIELKRTKGGHPLDVDVTVTNGGRSPAILLKPLTPRQVLFPSIYWGLKVMMQGQTLQPTVQLPKYRFNEEENMEQLQGHQVVRIEVGRSFTETYKLGKYYDIPQDQPYEIRVDPEDLAIYQFADLRMTAFRAHRTDYKGSDFAVWNPPEAIGADVLH